MKVASSNQLKEMCVELRKIYMDHEFCVGIWFNPDFPPAFFNFHNCSPQLLICE